MNAEKPDEPEQKPLLRVLTPDATPEQVAAVVAVLSSLGGGTAAPKQRSAWASPGRRMRTPQPHGRGGWRASALPR